MLLGYQDRRRAKVFGRHFPLCPAELQWCARLCRLLFLPANFFPPLANAILLTQIATLKAMALADQDAAVAAYNSAAGSFNKKRELINGLTNTLADNLNDPHRFFDFIADVDAEEKLTNEEVAQLALSLGQGSLVSLDATELAARSDDYARLASSGVSHFKGAEATRSQLYRSYAADPVGLEAARKRKFARDSARAADIDAPVAGPSTKRRKVSPVVQAGPKPSSSASRTRSAVTATSGSGTSSKKRKASPLAEAGPSVPSPKKRKEGPGKKPENKKVPSR